MDVASHPTYPMLGLFVSHAIVVSTENMLAPSFEYVIGGGVPGQWQTIL